MHGRRILWYSCGPTVYDSAHLGHARTYLSLDIIQRILEEYFHYDVISVMNITDIDDKIIKRSNEREMKFTDIARQYEKEFFEDMESLGCKKPNILTRVSEYIPEVLEMISTIIKNGFAYESNGSVYFDVPAFRKAHSYGKLVPENVGNAINEENTEEQTSDKHNPSDFALWKASKPNEPFWDSPWGKGRPGWHIECSAMSTDTFKIYGDGVMDIHAGGVDLRFPHHDNEMAQTEAYLNHKQCVNYFLHTGHLNIDGLKMSKSLKNFITIREALKTYSARQMRLCYLYHKWDQGLNYTDGAMELSVAKEKIFNDFFQNIKALLYNHDIFGNQHLDKKDRDILKYLDEVKENVYNALCDDFDTPSVMDQLESLVRSTNKYLLEENPRSIVLECIGNYVTEIFKCFGLINPNKQIGFAIDNSEPVDKIIAPYIDIISQFRDRIRQAVKSKEDSKKLLDICDEVRDDILPFVGIRLEDTNGKTIWKYDDKDQLLKERDARIALKKEKEAKKAKQEEENRKKEEERRKQAEINPKEMFKNDELYSEYDENGIPIKDKEGKEISKSSKKKLLKQYEQQKKLYEQYHK